MFERATDRARSALSRIELRRPCGGRWPLFSALLLVGWLAGQQADAQPHSGVVVNSVPLDLQTLAALQRVYPVPIRPGRYWYDPVAGVYGPEGGPVSGQMSAGLQIGGPLRADASRGNSGVYINGRHITHGEKAYIERACSTVIAPRRYWVNAQGLGGFEGSGAIFNLARCNPPTQARTGGSMSRTFCDPDGSCRSTGILGSILTVPRQ